MSDEFAAESSSYLSAFKTIAYALSRREQFIVVTGPIGTGKTSLCRMIGEQHGPRTAVAILSSPPHDVDDLLRRILDGFGLLTDDTRRSVDVSHFGLLKIFQQFLTSLTRMNAQAILVFDESQRLTPQLLEEIRLLSNLTSDAQTLQIVLVGEPELGDLLARSDLRQLAQRVSRRHRLEPITVSEVPGHVEQRLSAAPSRAARSAMVSVRVKRSHARIAIGAALAISALFFWVVSSSSGVPAEVKPNLPTTDDNREAERTPSVAAAVPSAPAPQPANVPEPSLPSAPAGPQGDNSAVLGSSFRTSDRAPASARSTAPLPNLADLPLNELLSRATRLAGEGNVRALQQIRDQIVNRQGVDSASSPGEFTAALSQLEGNLDEARRRRLEEDRRQLTGKP